MKDVSYRESDYSLLDVLDREVLADHWNDAERLVGAFLAAHQSVHDGYRNLVARLLSWICSEYGEPEVQRLNEAHGTWADFQPAVSLPPRDLVQRIADINHWHMSRFKIIEDDAKITFLLQPCGSGGRLINEGRYYSTRVAPYALVRRPSASTFGMPDFPVYCNHCSEMSRTILQGGGHGWIIEGWTPDHRWGGCRLHVYKKYEWVDGEFFQRLALKPPDRPAVLPANRIFSDSELRELSVSAPDHLRECIRSHDAIGALARLKQARVSWVDALRPAYQRWATTLYMEINNRFGSAAFEKAVHDSAWELLSKVQELADTQEVISLWTAYWQETGALRAKVSSMSGRTYVVALPTLFTAELRALVISAGEAFRDSFATFLARDSFNIFRLDLRDNGVLNFHVA